MFTYNFKLKNEYQFVVYQKIRVEKQSAAIQMNLRILNQMDFHLVQNRKENYHHDHIPFNVKGIGSIVFSVHTHTRMKMSAKRDI